MIYYLTRLTDWILKGGSITFKEALRLSEIDEHRDIISLFSFANMIRDKFKGPDIELRHNINVKIRECEEGCNSCFQTADYDIDISDSPDAIDKFINKNTENAIKNDINRFSLVVCGKHVNGSNVLEPVSRNIKSQSSEYNIESFATLGSLTGDKSSICGISFLNRDNNHLEIGEAQPEYSDLSFYERINILKSAKTRGFKSCSGVEFGIEETFKQRIELAYILRELDVDSIALNFNIPKNDISKDENTGYSLEFLKLIAIYRFIHPQKDIIVSGKNWKNIKTILSIIYLAGANSIMYGSYFAKPNKNTLENIKSLEEIIFFK